MTQSERLSSFAALAIAGQVMLTGTAWLLPIASEYDLVDDSMSELVLGRYGLIQTAAFVLAGIGTLGLVAAVHTLMTKSRAAAIGAMLMVIWGAGAILSAVFPTDRIDRAADVWSQSSTGTVHLAIALSFPAIILGMFVLSWAFRRDPAWRSLARSSAVLAGVALSLFLVQGEGPIGGVLQRLLVGVISAWLILVAFKVRTIAAALRPERETLRAAQPAWVIWLLCMAVVLGFVWLLAESVSPDPTAVGRAESHRVRMPPGPHVS